MHIHEKHTWKKRLLKWILLRKKTKTDEGKLCYCGHTFKCDCCDPDLTLFKESVERGTIIENDPKNGWKSFSSHKQ